MKTVLSFIISVYSLTAHARDLESLYKKTKLKLGKEIIEVYIADTEEGRAQGLMFIEKIPESTGMIFVFENEQPLGFWMKNTLIPLAIGFFDKSGKLIKIEEMQIAKSLMDLSPPSYTSGEPARFALEMNTGWFTKHAIKTGAHLERIGKSPSPLLDKALTSRH